MLAGFLRLTVRGSLANQMGWLKNHRPGQALWALREALKDCDHNAQRTWMLLMLIPHGILYTEVP